MYNIYYNYEKISDNISIAEADILYNAMSELKEYITYTNYIKLLDDMKVQTNIFYFISDIPTIANGYIERVTNGIKSIDSDHAYIHEGMFFQYDNVFILAATTGTRYIAMLTPEEKYVHFRFSNIISSADKLTIEFFEGATITPETGTPIIPNNHNRVSSKVSGCTILDNATVTNDGIKLDQYYIAGATGVGGTVSGSQLGQRSNEWILKQNTWYVYKFSNASSSQNIVNTNTFWYEEDYA
jgi:hypothetical protein